MAFANILQATSEGGDIAQLLSHHPEIREQSRRLVVTGCIPQGDCGLDICPNGLSAPLERLKPPLLFLGLLQLFPAPFGRRVFLLPPSAPFGDFPRGPSQISGGAAPGLITGPAQSLPNPAAKGGGEMGVVPVKKIDQQGGLFPFRQGPDQRMGLRVPRLVLRRSIFHDSSVDQIAVDRKKVGERLKCTGQRRKIDSGLDRIVGRYARVHRHQPDQMEQAQITVQNTGTQRRKRPEPTAPIVPILNFQFVPGNSDNDILADDAH